MIPDRRLIQARLSSENFFLNRLTPKLRESHHAADPRNTPVTMRRAEPMSKLDFPRPIPEKIPMKKRIVMGFVTVKKKTEV